MFFNKRLKEFEERQKKIEEANKGLTLGDNIKKYRKINNLTQKQLAEKIGVTVVTIQNYENTRREPNSETLKKIAEALGVSVATLWQDVTPSPQQIVHVPTTGDHLSKQIVNILEDAEILTKEEAKALYSLPPVDRERALFSLVQHEKDTIPFSSLAFYKTHVNDYWLDVVTWYPLDEKFNYKLNELKENEKKELAKALEFSFDLKLKEIIERGKK